MGLNPTVTKLLALLFSSAFDCLPHELIIAKLHAYGFSLSALKFFHQSYISNRKQRTKINEKAIAHGEESYLGYHRNLSILGPVLFNIFICDLFFIIYGIDFACYADDNIPYTAGNMPEDLVESLKHSSEKLFEWFTYNQMKANTDKCHLLISIKTPIIIKIDETYISNSDCEKLLGVNIDSKLNFNSHHDIKKVDSKD